MKIIFLIFIIIIGLFSVNQAFAEDFKGLDHGVVDYDPHPLIRGFPATISCEFNEQFPDAEYTLKIVSFNDAFKYHFDTTPYITDSAPEYTLNVTCQLTSYSGDQHTPPNDVKIFDRAVVPYNPPNLEDVDNDKIDNKNDACPTEPENYNGYLDSDGCPEIIPELNIVIHRINETTFSAVCEIVGEVEDFWLAVGYVDFDESYPLGVIATETLFISRDQTNNFIPEMIMRNDGSDIAVFCDGYDFEGHHLTTIQYVRHFIENEPKLDDDDKIPRDDTNTLDGTDDLKNNKKKNGGCADCTPPTLGLTTDFKRVVENGFSYNYNPVDVKKWYTPYPLINAAVGALNTVDILVYENNGINNMRMVQFGLGATHLGQPLHDLEVLFELPLVTNGTNNHIEVGEINIRDPDNLIYNDSVMAHANVTECIDDIIKEECVRLRLHYSYRESTINNMMVVSVSDKPRNSQQFYFNHGVQVLGDSVNEPPTYILHNKYSSQQTDNLTLTLTRTDKINHIWEDENGIEYLQISESRFDRITPAEPWNCNDPPLDTINVPTRNNCNFRALTTLWD